MQIRLRMCVTAVKTTGSDTPEDREATYFFYKDGWKYELNYWKPTKGSSDFIVLEHEFTIDVQFSQGELISMATAKLHEKLAAKRIESAEEITAVLDEIKELQCITHDNAGL